MWQQLAMQLDRLLSQPPNSSSAPRSTEARMSIMFPGLRRTSELHPVTELYNTGSPADEQTVRLRNTRAVNNSQDVAMINKSRSFLFKTNICTSVLSLSLSLNQLLSANISPFLSSRGGFVYSTTKMALALALTTEVFTSVTVSSIGTIFLFYLFWLLQWFTLSSRAK